MTRGNVEPKEGNVSLVDTGFDDKSRSIVRTVMTVHLTYDVRPAPDLELLLGRVGELSTSEGSERGLEEDVRGLAGVALLPF
jgi:hypothetical protein